MRTIWNALSILAIANLLGLGAFAGWLFMSDRLDGQRVEQIREMLSETINQEKARLDDEANALEEARLQAEADAKKTALPLGTMDSVSLKLELSEIDRQRLLRRQREMTDLQLSLQRERELLDRDVASFEAEKADFESWRTRLLEIEGADQFKKTLATYEGMKAKDATASLQALLDLGDRDQVVTYLSAMDERKRTKIMTEFNEADPGVAADLLEALRTRGTELRDAGEPAS